MEKKRRKRINDSLNNLKNILLLIMDRDPAQTAKLEKADILELTVDYLKHKSAEQKFALHSEPTFINYFQGGWNDCLKSVAEFFHIVNNTDPNLKIRLLQHLQQCRPLPSRIPVMINPMPLGQGLNLPFDRMPGPVDHYMIKNLKTLVIAKPQPDEEELKQMENQVGSDPDNIPSAPWRPWSG